MRYDQYVDYDHHDCYDHDDRDDDPDHKPLGLISWPWVHLSPYTVTNQTQTPRDRLVWVDDFSKSKGSPRTKLTRLTLSEQPFSSMALPKIPGR